MKEFIDIKAEIIYTSPLYYKGRFCIHIGYGIWLGFVVCYDHSTQDRLLVKYKSLSQRV